MSASLDVLLVTPAPPGSLLGNRITAERWARLLRELGHRVRVELAYEDDDCDLLIALHARRSAQACARYKALHPARPLILALTGTDLYRDLAVSPEARRSLALAERLIVLHPRGADALEPALRERVRPILQSVELPEDLRRITPEQDDFRVCVLGHLRPVKDPLRTAEAARLLPPDSRVRVVQLGRALEESLAERAREEQERNPRYEWRGELPHAEALAVLAGSRLHVLSSELEGGANALCEAIATGVPTLASAIDSSMGILGDDYPGLFPVGDTRALAELLTRAERDAAFLAELCARCAALAELLRPEREREALAQLLAELPFARDVEQTR